MPWQLLDYPVTRLTVPIVAGVFPTVVSFPAVPNNQVWRVDQISCALLNYTADPDAFLSNIARPQVLLFDQPINPATVPIQGGALTRQAAPGASPLNAAYYAFDDQGSPLTIRGGDALSVAFYPSGTVGGIAAVRIQYQSLLGTAGQPQPIAGAQPAPI